MTVRPSGCALGAHVEGIDLAALDAPTFDALRSAVHEHGVVWVAGQDHLTDDDQLALARRFGPVFRHPVMDVFDITDERVEVIEDTADAPPAADRWHTDVTFAPIPPAFAILRADVVPASGGDTLWSSQVRAYAALAAPLRRLVDELEVEHAPTAFIEAAQRKVGPDLVARMVEALPVSRHPATITHPVTGARALYVNRDFCRQVVGLSHVESSGLLDLLCAHATLPTFQVRHRWSLGDVAIWDERITQHLAVPDHYPQHRRMRRITVAADAPPQR
jgi:taurine dioxygenase